MKTPTLARIMVLVGALGWSLIGWACGLWIAGGLSLRDQGASVTLFVSLLFSGSFAVGLSQAWFLFFAILTGRAMERAATIGGRPTETMRGAVLGCVGCGAVVGLVSSVLVLGAAQRPAAPIPVPLLTFLVVVAVGLILEWLWVDRFSRRSAPADPTRV